MEKSMKPWMVKKILQKIPFKDKKIYEIFKIQLI